MPAFLIAAAFFGGDAILMGAALGAFGVAAASFAVTFVVSALVSRAFAPGDPNANAGVDNGVRQQNPPAPTNNLPIVYGDAYLGGTFVDAVLSIDQKTMYYVLAISSIAESTSNFVFDTTKMYYSDRTITFDSTDLTKVISLTDGAGNVDTKISGNLYISLYTSNYAGTITGVNTSVAPSTLMGGSDIASGQRWSPTNRQMNGLAFAIVKLNYSRDAQTTQMQPITFHVSQYLNGAGAAYPGAVYLDYMKSRVYGAGMDAALVDATSAAALDTYSQATITFTNNSGASATQPRYKVNGVLDTGQSVLANIDRIMAACDSWNQYNEANGKWSVVINKASSSTFAFDDNNIIGEIKTSLLDLTSSINQVEAQFPSALNRDQRDVVYIETPSILLYANEPINKYSCNFDLVNDSVQANYLANRMLEQAREDLNVTINAAYTAIQVDAGDVVTLTNAAYGWNNKLFRAMKVSEICLADGNLGATLELSEYNALVYDDNDIRQYNPTPNSNLNSASYFSALAAPTISATRPDNDIPSFDIAVVTPSVGRTTTLQLYYSTTATPTPSQWTLLDAFNSPLATSLTQSSTFTFLNQILPAGTYYFGVVAANDIGQSQISSPSTALIWTPTGTTGTQTATVYLYQWLMSTPGNPSGTSTYTWATATNSAYTGGNGWTTTIPSNPGTAGISLWQASIGLSALATATTSTVSWASGYAVNAISTNGSSGTSGTSAVRAYAIYSGNPTVTGASVTKSGTALPATTDFSPTSATAFTTTTQTPGASEAMFQSDGLYYPVTNQTVWNTPYLSNLKVGSLSAISADLGTITAGDLSIGSLPTLSGTGMTGTGSHFYSNGNYALGTSSKNLVFNGTDVYLNGNLIATDNINTNAVTISTGAYTTGSANLPLNGGSTTLQSLSYTSNGSPVYIAFTAVISYYAVLRSPGSGGTYYPFRQSWQILLYRNSTLILTNFAFALIAPDLTASITGSYPLAISFSDTPSSGSVTYDVVIQETTNSGQTGYNGAGGNYYYVYNRNLFTLETKK